MDTLIRTLLIFFYETLYISFFVDINGRFDINIYSPKSYCIPGKSIKNKERFFIDCGDILFNGKIKYLIGDNYNEYL